MKYKIGFVICYFGKLPEHFNLYLTSCKFNPDICWHIFTNDTSEYEIPDNVFMHYLSFEELVSQIQKCFDFKIVCNRTYKLCDYKPAYGDIFKEYLSDCEFFGHVDADMLFGDIRKFITDEILEQYEKILVEGFCSIYKNNEKMRKAYMMQADNCLYYKDVFTNEKNRYFDEWGLDEDTHERPVRYGMIKIMSQNNVKIYNKILYANVLSIYHTFKTSMGGDKASIDFEMGKKHVIYSFENGKIYQQYIDEKGLIQKEERMFIHFMKRNIKYKLSEEKNVLVNQFLIVPNKFIDYKELTAKKQKRLAPYLGCFDISLYYFFKFGIKGKLRISRK